MQILLYEGHTWYAVKRNKKQKGKLFCTYVSEIEPDRCGFVILSREITVPPEEMDRAVLRHLLGIEGIIADNMPDYMQTAVYQRNLLQIFKVEND